MLSLALIAVVASGPKLDLVGAWTAKVQFKSGDFAAIKDLEFLLVFNQGGTMTESSNYDGAPPVPPAYGIWKRIGAGRFEAKYVFYNTKPPVKDLSEGWLPAGKGVLTEKIRISNSGQAYDSTLTLDMFDAKGKHSSSARAAVHGVRMRF